MFNKFKLKLIKKMSKRVPLSEEDMAILKKAETFMKEVDEWKKHSKKK